MFHSHKLDYPLKDLGTARQRIAENELCIGAQLDNFSMVTQCRCTNKDECGIIFTPSRDT